MASQEPVYTTPVSKEAVVTVDKPVALSKYTSRVVLKSILERSDGGRGLDGERVVVGGWVKSSKEVEKQAVALATPPTMPRPQPPQVGDDKSGVAKEVSFVEILQSRIPFLRTIIKVLGCTNNAAHVRQKLESIISKPAPPTPPASIVFLQVSDGSCVASLQVAVDSSIAPPSNVMPTGTCIVAEGVLKQPPVNGKHVIELRVEKILHIGTVEQDKYPLSKKRLPLDMLRDFSHFRPRTTTVASVTRIRSAMSLATHTFLQNNGFMYVQVPIITTTDTEGFSEKFQVTTLLNKAIKKEEFKVINGIDGVSLEMVKASLKEKSNLVDELKRTDSNKEALVAAVQDLKKTNELASQLEARKNFKQLKSIKADSFNFSEDFFCCQTYLTVSGRLHLESYACALGNVYSFGPRFRADKTESAKHAAEMWMVDVEIAFSQLEDAINCADDYFKSLCKCVLDNCLQDLDFVSKRIDKTCIDRLQSMISGSSAKVSYEEAVDALQKVADKKFESKLERGMPLTAEHLSYLADELYKRPVIIYNYPKAVKPFYVRLNTDGKTVAAFDMVVPKVGIVISGSQNEERINMLNTRIEELGLARAQYEWYLDLRRHGTVMHSGFSLGFDLMVLFITGLTDVIDAIPFPRRSGKAYI
ncbi:tRNA-synt_2 domain-containing protein [Cephalotus follicularis]|uniref:asparagine--tRNA ligase n=1 Tax=Cephalotus follicularis TaxID=3775 RepID=A0A1Q3BRZ8_CEPFO|nr:tRNA-synt_2 domain-containing protein [Cephalotus follicularis]